MTERLRGRIGMVRVLVSSPEDRVDHVPVPSHLKRLKAFYPFVGGRRAVALLGLIVVHHHGIQAQEDQRRRLQPPPPQEQLLQQAAKQPDAIHVKAPEKALDRMRGQQRLRARLNGSRVPFVLLQRVEVHQVAARSVQEKAEQLLEDLRDGLPFAALAQGAEEPVPMGENLNPPQIARKEAQSGASSQLIGGGFNVINQGSGMTVGCVSIGHVCTPFGLGVVR